MSYLSLIELKAVVNSALTDTELQAVIDRVEGEVTDELGEPQDSDLTVELTKRVFLDFPSCYIFLPRPVYLVTSITLYADDEGLAEILDSTYYRVIAGEGSIQRLPAGSKWLSNVFTDVVYKPAYLPNLWKRTLIDLTRLELERPAMDNESVAGEYSFQAGNFDIKRRALMRRLSFLAL